MNASRGPWFLLTGVLIGLILGVVYAWLVSPVAYYDTTPRTLRQDFKDQQRALIALAYQADADFGRAKARLALLGDSDDIATLAAQAQRYLGEGKAVEAAALARLAGDLKNPPPPLVITPTMPAATPTIDPLALTPTPTNDPNLGIWTATPTFTPVFTFTPRPTGTPVPTLGAPFMLAEKVQVCNPAQPLLLEFEVQNSAGASVPGVRIHVTWQSGESYFFTGLAPQISPGYADFEMAEGVAYTAQVGDGGELVTNLTPPDCVAENGTPYFGGWWLRFMQP